MSRGRRITVVGLVVVVAVLGLSVLPVVPKYQLLSRTRVILGVVLELYVQAHGRMPTGFSDLESAGLLRAISWNGKTEWQVATSELPPTVLLRVEDLSVKWGIPIESLALRDGRIVDPKTGQLTRIIESKRWYVSSSDAISIRLYRLLAGKCTPSSSPREEAEEG